jgi:hypothetical protein
MADLYGPMLGSLGRLLESNDLDAIAKACAMISRHYLADTEAGRLSADQKPGGHLDWLQYLDSDELEEMQSLLADFEQLARERQDAGCREWRPGVGVALPPARRLPDIEVAPSGNGNGNGNGETR